MQEPPIASTSEELPSSSPSSTADQLHSTSAQHEESASAVPTSSEADAELPLGGGADADDTAGPDLSAEEEAAMLSAAESLKAAGNQLYLADQNAEAQAKYRQALEAAPPNAQQRAVYYANIAACNLKLHEAEAAVQNCTLALQVDPVYVKALMRRSSAFEELEDLDHALADAQQVASLDSDNAWAVKALARLQPLVTAKQEAVKDEMLGKLKDLGNTLLGKFGMSLDNFKAEKDPTSGSYSIKFER